VEGGFSRSDGRRRVDPRRGTSRGRVGGLVLDGWDQAELAVQASLVVPVEVLGGGDLDVVDPSPRALVADQLSFVGSSQIRWEE